jgi:hypothetical protein
MVAGLRKRCQGCWVFFHVTSHTILLRSVSHHCRRDPQPSQTERRSICFILSRISCAKKRQSAKHEIGQLRSKLAHCNAWWLSRYPLSVVAIYLLVGSGGRTESENVNCQLLSNEWRRLSPSSFSANNVVVLYSYGPYLTLAISISWDE